MPEPAHLTGAQPHWLRPDLFYRVTEMPACSVRGAPG